MAGIRAALVLLLVLAPPSLAAAEDAGRGGGRDQGRFFDFEGLIIDGELRKPGAFLATARERARFERLLRLRKSFLDALVRSAADPALKRAE